MFDRLSEATFPLELIMLSTDECSGERDNYNHLKWCMETFLSYNSNMNTILKISATQSGIYMS